MSSLFANFLERVPINGVQHMLRIAPEDAYRLSREDMQARKDRIERIAAANQAAIEADQRASAEAQRIELARQEAENRAAIANQQLGLESRRVGLAERGQVFDQRVQRANVNQAAARLGLDRDRFRVQADLDTQGLGLRRDQFDQDKLQDARTYMRNLTNDAHSQRIDNANVLQRMLSETPGMLGMSRQEVQGLVAPGTGFDAPAASLDPYQAGQYQISGVKILEDQVKGIREHLAKNKFSPQGKRFTTRQSRIFERSKRLVLRFALMLTHRH